MRLQDHALDDKPAIAQMADVLSRHFILVLLFIAAGVWTFWHFHQPEQAFWVTLAVLVATCPAPCRWPLPTALTSATARLTRAGILLRRGHVLDVLTRANRIVMDKTGTLTTGNISLTSTEALGNLDAARCLAIAHALEAYSEHPIARAFRSNAAEDAVLLAASKVTPVIGHGIEGVIEGRHYRLGSARWLGISDAQETRADGLVIYLADEVRALARFLLTDTLRPDAKALIQAFKAAGLKTTILTGDSSAQADEVARELGSTSWSGRHAGWQAGLPQGARGPRRHQHHGGRWHQRRPGAGRCPRILRHGRRHRSGQEQRRCHLAGRRSLPPAGCPRPGAAHPQDHQGELRLVHRLQPAGAAAGGERLAAPYVAAAGMSLSSLIVVTNSMRLNR